MTTHSFEFVPLEDFSGWTIDDNGDPRIWWHARLTHDHPVLLSNKRDARQLKSNVNVTIGTETQIGKMSYTGVADPTFKWGYFTCPPAAVGHSESVSVHIAVSRENFDRILAAARNRTPPTIAAGFGPVGFLKRLQGPITQDRSTDAYRWDNETQPQVIIESCDFQVSRPPIEGNTGIPERSKEPARVFPGLEVAFSVIWNAVAVLITLALFNATNSKFETVAVSVLALIYLTIIDLGTTFPRLLAKMQLSQLMQFYQLRSLLGGPAEVQETKYLESVRNALTRRDAKFVIHLYGSGVIGLLVAYKLIMLMF